MALPAAGNPLSLDQLHVEAGGTSGTLCSLNDEDIRQIIGVSADGSQNIQQYYGQSSTPPLASSVEVATVTNDGTNRYYTFSFSGGVSDRDVIIAASFNYAAGTSATYGTLGTVSGARAQYTDTNARHYWNAGASFFSEMRIQSVVCGSSTSNSFSWDAGAAYGIPAQAGLVAIKYSTGGTSTLNGRDYKMFGTSSTQSFTGSPRPSTSGDTATTIEVKTSSNVVITPNASTQDGVIAVAFRGGDAGSGNGSANLSPDRTGDTSGSLTLYGGNHIKYWAKSETPAQAGTTNYTTTNVNTGWGGTSWMYFGAAFELVK